MRPQLTDAERKLTDPAAQKLAEWFILRDPDSQAEFYRFAAFISDNPGWPGTAGLLHRRAEARLWQEKSSAATVHAFTGDQPAKHEALAQSRNQAADAEREIPQPQP